MLLFVQHFSPLCRGILPGEKFCTIHQILSVSVMLSFSKMPLCCCVGRKKTPEVKQSRKKQSHLLPFIHLKWLQRPHRCFLYFIKPVHKGQLYKVLWHADVNSDWVLHSWALKGIQSLMRSDQEITAGYFFKFWKKTTTHQTAARLLWK